MGENLTLLKKNINIGVQWLLRSGIQNTTFDESLGGFSAWYDLDQKVHSFVYSQATGYALNLLVSNKSAYPSKRMDEAIDLATYYLTNLAFNKKRGAVRCRFLTEKGWLDNYCAFDNIVVANALINRHRMDGDKESLKVAKKILDFLMKNMFFGEGFYARYLGAENRYQNDPVKWSSCSGSYHAKAALPLLNMYDLTGDKQYLDFVRKIIPGILKYQDTSGRFVTNTSTNETFMHPHLYTIEGLMVAENFLKNTAISRAIDKGLGWSSSMRMAHAGLMAYYTAGRKIESGSPDINSQYLRLLVLRGADTKDEYIQALIHRILAFQRDNPRDSKTFGGFQIGEVWFFNQQTRVFEKLKNHINTWATVFALNAFNYLNEKDTNIFTLC
jgi:hypothetical protein